MSTFIAIQLAVALVCGTICLTVDERKIGCYCFCIIPLLLPGFYWAWYAVGWVGLSGFLSVTGIFEGINEKDASKSAISLGFSFGAAYALIVYFSTGNW